MENETILIVDAITGETKERPATENEIAEQEKSYEEFLQIEADQLAKEKAREDSIRKMAEASGLSEAEIEALF